MASAARKANASNRRLRSAITSVRQVVYGDLGSQSIELFRVARLPAETDQKNAHQQANQSENKRRVGRHT